ncbi:hypothetical protein BT96DRAFT_984851 [Gymnopus androsaceus JB14]|uniref:Thioredoxin domain-containing protein n=1 Tax=Gymnopus androsaceus JB14 TaxID=1447944 RepID=A0A6A4IIP7_9AGAR|nr:hypothetical protein BT96DRAFT_984851 [Gymnopus androsaceus JB14]
MPLQTSNTIPDSLTASEEYLIFYSSIVNGRLWCPDCNAVDGLVKSTFSSEDAPSALIIYVGDRPTSVEIPVKCFQGGTFKIQSVPTILKIQNGKEVGRLVDSEITPGLANFIRS